MSKTKFSSVLNVDKSAIGRWESGATHISPMGDRLIRIIAIQHAPVDSYLDDLLESKPTTARGIRVQKSATGWTTG